MRESKRNRVLQKTYLNFDEENEFDLYRQVCREKNINGVPKKQGANSEIATYCKWKEHICDLYRNTNNDVLIELSRYLNHNQRKLMPIKEIAIALYTALFAPAVALYTQLVSRMQDGGLAVKVAILIGIVLALGLVAWVINYIVKNIWNTQLRLYFYTDYKEIIDEIIKQKRKKE